MTHMNRRGFLRSGGAWIAGGWLGAGLLRTAGASGAPVTSGPGVFGPLGPPDELGIRLPAGFRARVVAEATQPVAGTGHTWHGFPDGGAVFGVRGGGWVYVSNSELPFAAGVGAIRFDRHANIVDAYPILEGSFMNCAGGATPWGTWLSCEEFENQNIAGHVWECDPLGERPAVQRSAMGGFQHEAAAVDPRDSRVVYLTEDQPDGCLYRFTSDVAGDLSSGLLEVAEVVDDGSGGPGGVVTWHPVPVPDPDLRAGDDPTRRQVAAATPFDGGEGIVFARGRVFFTTKGDDRVWSYDPETAALCVHYDADLDPGRQLTGVDNITASFFGDLYVAEDGGNMELVMLSVEGVASPVLRIEGQEGSELAGPAFDPVQRHLYISSQRGARDGRGVGITYEITGPFLRGAGCS